MEKPYLSSSVLARNKYVAITFLSVDNTMVGPSAGNATLTDVGNAFAIKQEQHQITQRQQAQIDELKRLVMLLAKKT